MSIKNKTQLKAEVSNLVRTGGQGGKTKAADVRTILTDMIDSGITTINNTSPDASGNIAIPSIERSYTVTYYVSPAGNNATAKKNSKEFPFASIKEASIAGAAEVANGQKVLVYVFAGLYNEFRINRDKVDLYFERGAIVYTDDQSVGSCIITDHSIGNITCNVYGQGEFYHLYNYPGYDREGVNISNASKFYIEARRVDSVQVWNGPTASLEIRNLEILYALTVQANKIVKAYDCKLLSGFFAGEYYSPNTLVELHRCEFHLPELPNTLNNIYDSSGNLLLTISPARSAGYDTSGKSQQQIIDFVESAPYAYPSAVALDYNESLAYNFGGYFDNYRLRVYDPVIKIRRPKGIGIRVLQHFDNPLTEVVVVNAVVHDETATKECVALVQGAKPAASDPLTVPLGYSVTGLRSDALTLYASPSGYTFLIETYRNFSQAQLSLTAMATALEAAQTVERQLPFDTNIIVPHQQGFLGKHQLLSDKLPNEISSVAYFTQLDSETTWTARTDLAAINAWVNATITETIQWRLKTVPAANPAAGTGLCEIIRRTKKL